MTHQIQYKVIAAGTVKELTELISEHAGEWMPCGMNPSVAIATLKDGDWHEVHSIMLMSVQSPSQDDIDTHHLKHMQTMAEARLPPNVFEMWETVRLAMGGVYKESIDQYSSQLPEPISDEEIEQIEEYLDWETNGVQEAFARQCADTLYGWYKEAQRTDKA